MSNNAGLLYRNSNPRMAHYPSDGLGRDSYITFNNGGFWLDNIKSITPMNIYDVSKYKGHYYSKRKNVAPFKYYSDGSGRDGYIIHESGGLERNYKPLKNYNLKDFLRTPESAIFNFKASPMKEGVSAKTLYISKREWDKNMAVKNVERGLVRRLYNSEKHKFINNKEKAPKKYKNMLRSYEDFPQIKNVEREEKVNDVNEFSETAMKIGFYENEKHRHSSLSKNQLNKITQRYLSKTLNKNISFIK